MLEKFHLRGGKGNQDPGDPGMGKVRGGGDFFSFKQGKGLTLDDTMNKTLILNQTYSKKLQIYLKYS